MKAVLVLAILLAGLSGPAFALRLDRDKPLEGDGDHFMGGRRMYRWEERFFDFDEDGILSRQELELADQWEKEWKKSDKGKPFRRPFKRTWMYRFFDMNNDGIVNDFERKAVPKTLAYWKKIDDENGQ